MREQRDFGFWFWLHLAIIVAIYSSPFFFSWWIILCGIVLYHLQLLIFGGCLLSQKEFGERGRDHSFHRHYLKRLFGIDLPPRVFHLFLDYGVPVLLVAGALVWQVLLDVPPLIS